MLYYNIIGFINENNVFSLCLFANLDNTCEININDKIDINSDSLNLSCDNLNSFNGNEELICF